MRKPWVWLQRNLWIFGLVVILGGGIAYVQASSEQRASAERLEIIASCQADYNKAFAAAIAERSSSSAAERAALLKGQQVQADINTAQQRLITSIINNQNDDPEQRIEALRQFNAESEEANRQLAVVRADTDKAVADANQARVENPIPTNRC